MPLRKRANPLRRLLAAVVAAVATVSVGGSAQSPTKALVAHRGASAYAPENTLEAFVLARRLGATGLESDVWLTADGEPVLDHDGVVRRRFGRSTPITEVRRGELPSHIPSLADLQNCIHCGFCLPTCPTYVLWGEEMDSPRGRILLMDLAERGEIGDSAWRPGSARAVCRGQPESAAGSAFAALCHFTF